MFLAGLAGLVLLMAAALAAYYALSYFVLWALGRLLPLAGRRRRH
jgi:hypothetical protein